MTVNLSYALLQSGFVSATLLSERASERGADAEAAEAAEEAELKVVTRWG